MDTRHVSKPSQNRAVAASSEHDLCVRLATHLQAAGCADLVQESLLRTLVVARRGEIRDPDRVVAFSRTVCRRLRWRRSVVARRVVSESVAETAFANATAESEPPLRMLPGEHQRLMAGFAALDDESRTVVERTYWGDRTASEIGAELGRTANHVRVIRCRALAKLRDAVG